MSINIIFINFRRVKLGEFLAVVCGRLFGIEKDLIEFK